MDRLLPAPGYRSIMTSITSLQPKLRPLEARPLLDGDSKQFIIRDPSGLADAVLTVSEPALFILSLLDGRHERKSVQEKFIARYGAMLKSATLDTLIDNLERSRFLDGPSFDRYFAGLCDDYRAAPTRPSIFASRLGSAGEVEALLEEMLPSSGYTAHGDGRLTGLIAPHLDYARGRPCYVSAYSALRGRTCPDRCVILGTNHFGRSYSVVATGKSFETPLGVTAVDVRFLEAVEARCGYDLRAHEFDHRREHSIELQVLCLQHVFGPASFEIVPVLCPDPCGPTGMAPFDGGGVDLRDFALALRDVMDQFSGDTLLVAGADLSHVGLEFGDSDTLDDAFLSAVEARDRAALNQLVQSAPDGFVQTLALESNPTRVCSAGCMYVLARVLHDSQPHLLRYHQAHTPAARICVSCAALTYSR